MGKLITIDPVTRIEGHLRIDVEVDGGAVKNAWSSGTMWRGIETILQGRDPRDAWVFTQRICGVCTTVHAIASVRSVENALGLEIPLNAQLIRNVIMSAHALHDHIVHFYDAVGARLGRRGRGAEGRSGEGGEPRRLARPAVAGQLEAPAQGGEGQGRRASSRPASSASSRTATGATRR